MGRVGVLVVIVLVLVPGLLPAASQPPRGARADCITLDDFRTAAVGAFPREWEARKDAGREVYTVAEAPGLRFLRAVSRGLGVQAGRETKGWDLAARPVLAWAWRPRQFPRSADERDDARNDSALAVYLLVEHSRIAGPKAVKYVWSERVPAGTHLTSNRGLTQVRVLRTGAAGADWTEERVNVLDDFRRYFDETKTPTPAGIAVLTDADDTSSIAAGDYANFRACTASAQGAASPRLVD
ncbi:MAG TPA: DUF3047 domain-containing protein [Methylomirabilota bacterium]|nr:DUF3047 domain-containing protein [Methylomirabilota bacterium]